VLLLDDGGIPFNTCCNISVVALATFRDSFRPVMGHSISFQLMGFIRTEPPFPMPDDTVDDAAAAADDDVARTTPNSGSAVDIKYRRASPKDTMRAKTQSPGRKHDSNLISSEDVEEEDDPRCRTSSRRIVASG
jgi:hypothetical protein